MNLEQYDRCCMGGMDLQQVEFCEVRASDCGFVGGRWSHIHMQGCRFQNCNFRNVYLEEWDIAETLFRGCVFDGIVPERGKLSGVVFQECIFRGKIREFSDGCIFQNCFIDC